MTERIISQIVAPVLMLNVVGVGLPRVVHPELIETWTLTDAQQRDGLIARINGALARAEVRGQVIALGVDLQQTKDHVAALSDAEPALLEQRFDNSPASGSSVVGPIGAVFSGLLMLEFLGVSISSTESRYTCVYRRGSMGHNVKFRAIGCWL